MQYYIGLDSTDGPEGGCTTYTCSKIIDELVIKIPNLKFLDFPKLVRLNPNIPFKTRGNAALGLHIETGENLETLVKIIQPIVQEDYEKYAKNDLKTGLIITTTKKSFWDNRPVLQEFVSHSEYIDSYKPDYIFPKDSKGHIGALAAIYYDFSDDFTYEIIGYRNSENLGKIREIDNTQVHKLNDKFLNTFCSFDTIQNRELIAPSGNDPVFCGIRGDSIDEIKQFFNQLNLYENLHSWTIYKTNQATNDHVKHSNSELNNYNVFSGLSTILSNPKELRGGHIKIRIRSNIDIFDCLIFEPTKDLRNQSRLLRRGDLIYLQGNVKINNFGLHIAAEYMTIVNLVDDFISRSPVCVCGKKMTKAGKLQGFKCNNCGKKSKHSKKQKLERNLFIGQRVYASKTAQRHLTKPIERLHKKNRDESSQKFIEVKTFRGLFNSYD